MSTLDKNLLGQGDRDAFSRLGAFSRRPLPVLDARDRAGFVVWRKDQGIADLQRPGQNAAGNDPAMIKPVDILHRETERKMMHAPRRLEGIEHLGDGRAVVPWHPRSVLWRMGGDIESEPGADRDKRPRFETDLGKETA